MSLYEYSMLSVIRNIKDGKITISKDDLPNDIYDELMCYLDTKLKRSLKQSLSGNKFIISDYILTRIKRDDEYQIKLTCLLRDMLVYSATNGNMSAINYLIDKGADNWDAGLYGAVYSNDIELIEFFIEKGAKQWNFSLYAAVRRGNVQLVNYFIEKGANNWNQGLSNAILTRNHQLISFFETKPITNYCFALKSAIQIHDYDLIISYCNKIPNDRPISCNVLSLAQKYKEYDSITFVLKHIPIPINIKVQNLGPLMIKLIEKINFELPAEFGLPLMKTGLVMKEVGLLLWRLYFKQNNLRSRGGFKMDTFLHTLLSTIPSVYVPDTSRRFRRKWVLNHQQLTTITILDITPDLDIGRHLRDIFKINMFEDEQVHEPDMISSLYKEYLIIKSL